MRAPSSATPAELITSLDLPMTWDEALAEGIDRERERQYWDAPPGRKQTADAMLSDAMARAGRSPSIIDEFAFQLEDLPPGFEALPGALKRLEKLITTPNITSGALKRMPRAWVDDEERQQLTRLKMSVWDLWCVAVVRVAEHRPDVFGVIDRPMADHSTYVSALEARLAALGEILRTQYRGRDVVDLTADTSRMMQTEGYTLQVYRVPYEATGETIHRPPPGSGRVLLRWLVEHPQHIPKEG